MIKLAFAIIAFPLFLIGVIDFLGFLLALIDGESHSGRLYHYWVVAALWAAFVNAAGSELNSAFEDLEQRIKRTGKYQRDYWWLARCPGDLMVTAGKYSPLSREHYDAWKRDLLAKGFGPGKLDPGQVR